MDSGLCLPTSPKRDLWVSSFQAFHLLYSGLRNAVLVVLFFLLGLFPLSNNGKSTGLVAEPFFINRNREFNIYLSNFTMLE